MRLAIGTLGVCIEIVAAVWLAATLVRIIELALPGIQALGALSR